MKAVQGTIGHNGTKTSGFPVKAPLPRRAEVVDVVALGSKIKAAVQDALGAVEGARQKCLAAGHLLLEAKAALVRPRSGGRFVEQGEDGFMEWVRKSIPEISHDTAERWMRAAGNILKALPEPPAIDVESEIIPVSEILTRPVDELPEAARNWRRQWFDFTEKKTIKECLNGVFVEGDEAHRTDRAINGMTARGAGGGGDRKAWEVFTANKLKHLTTFFSKDMTAAQQGKIASAFEAALEQWPRWVIEAMAEKVRAELKLSEVERAARK